MDSAWQRLGDWVWRLALLGALGWIGWELHNIHGDLTPAGDEQPTQALADPLQDSVDEVREAVVALTEKVDAILIVMSRTR